MNSIAKESEISTSLAIARKDQLLHDHLLETALLAQKFAEKTGLGYLAYVCGLLHDLGKYSAAFQCYLRKALSGKPVNRGEIPHAWEGALTILRQLGNDKETIGFADILANIVASHHTGLTDMIFDSERVMPSRIEKYSKPYPDQMRDVLESKEVAEILSEIDWNIVRSEFADVCKRICKDSFSRHLVVKLLYSCLVDADRCNAAGIDNPDSQPEWDDIERCLNVKLKTFDEMPEEMKSPLDKVRASISDQCAKQAIRPTGIFTLSVPTGGGKTLSSLRFAIRHARENRLNRIVYVIPYLSIIDQTARDFRKLFGDRADYWLLEHHSNFLLESGDEDDEKRYDLGTQRWDAPVVVTTMVQFLESVFSNKASDLRKFHNMMRSVFIFDEVQALPVKCTHLFNATVNFLHEFGNSSCVMCSATQPALTTVQRPLHTSQNPDLVSLSEEDKSLFCRTELIDKTSPELTCEKIAKLALSKFRQGKSTLVVVNTKAEARNIFERISNIDNKYFLSTNMCPAHRLDVIDKMRASLDQECVQPVLCVSTQLIEAGVDISFDCVIRAEAGFDSIVQAAGRCNRHGRLSTPQEVIIVRIANEKLNNLPEIESCKEITDRLIRENLIGTSDKALETYYQYKFGNSDQKLLMDYPISGTPYFLFNLLGKNTFAQESFKNAHNGVPYLGLHSAFQFAAEHFDVIEGFHIGVVVPYNRPGQKENVQKLVDDYIKTCEQFKQTFDRENRTAVLKERSRILRKLQQYTISVYANQEDAIRAISSIVGETFYFLSQDHYDPIMGLTRQQRLLST